MQDEGRVYSLPRWQLARWLVDAGPGVPTPIRLALIGRLFGTLPVFAGGVINTLAVSAVIAMRLPTPPFVAWVIMEILVCICRLVLLIVARREAQLDRETPTDLYILMGIAWSACVGYGVFISLVSGDWIVATLACVSAAAMAGGICLRNFSAPRLAGTMIVISLGPCLPGAILAGEPLLYLAFLQTPLYLFAMTSGAYKLSTMLITTMRAERENDYRATHDSLTGLSNRRGIVEAFDRSLASARDRNPMLTLLFLDLDGFKTVNDTHGHVVGDRLLKMIADRLDGRLRIRDIAARIGGDEFVVLAEELPKEKAIRFGDALISALSAPYHLDDVSVRIGVSVGIAIAPEHGAKFVSLLRAADAALYEAKMKGKSQCCVAPVVQNQPAAPGLGAGRVGAAA